MRKAGFDAEPSLRVAVSVRQGIRNEIAERDASLLVLGHLGRARPADYLFGSMSEEIVSGAPVPAVVAMLDEAPIRRVLLPLRHRDLSGNGMAQTRIAVQIAGFLERSGLKLVVGTRDGATPEDPALPADAELVRFGGVARLGGRAARPGDLVLLPGGSFGLVFDAGRGPDRAGAGRVRRGRRRAVPPDGHPGRAGDRDAGRGPAGRLAGRAARGQSPRWAPLSIRNPRAIRARAPSAW